MNKDEVIKLLNKCLSSDEKIKKQEEYQEIINLLTNVFKDVNLLRNLNLDQIIDKCQINEDDLKEIKFYKLICELDNPIFKLTDEQIERIKELFLKYINKLKDDLSEITKESNKEKYLREIIEKIKQDRFILTGEDINYINNILSEKQTSVVKRNQVIMVLSLIVIKTLEDRLIKEQDKKQVSEEISDKELSNDDFIYQLDNILEKYGCLNIRKKLLMKLDVIRKETTLNGIDDVLRTLKEMNIVVNETIPDEIIYMSTGKIIKEVVNIYKKMTGNSCEQCFKILCHHVSIFVKNGDNSSYHDFIKNMYMLDELGVQPERIYLMDIEALCINHNRLKKNILTLERYQIPRECYLKSITVLKSGKNLSDELDIWVELGNGEAWTYLKNSLSILVSNNIKDFRNKFRILRDLGINITINDKYKSLKKDLFRDLDLINSQGIVTLDNKRCEVSFVPYKVDNPQYDELMNKRFIDRQEDMVSKNELYQRFINSVECVKNSYYLIPGLKIRVSKNKVYRVFNNLLNNGVNDEREMLIYAITYKSAITEEEYNTICEFVDKLLGNTLGKKGSVK